MKTMLKFCWNNLSSDKSFEVLVRCVISSVFGLGIITTGIFIVYSVILVRAIINHQFYPAVW